MEEFYHHVVKVCQQVVDKNNNSALTRQSRESSLSSTQYKVEGNSNGGDDDDDKEDRDDGGGDALPLDRAKRVLKRIELMNVIRDEILTNPQLDDLLAAGRRSPGLPSWWRTGIHDKPFLIGLAKHGVNRQDLIVEDEDLPFAAISRHLTELHKDHQRRKQAMLATEGSGYMNVKQEDAVEEAVKAAVIKLGHVQALSATSIDETGSMESKMALAFNNDAAKPSIDGVLDRKDVALDGSVPGSTELKQEPSSSPKIGAKEKPAAASEPEEFVWLKEAVVLRRVDHLIDIVLNPKPVSKKKRRSHAAQLALSNAGSAATSVGEKRKSREGDHDDSEHTEREEHSSLPPSAPASPSKKRRKASVRETPVKVKNNEDKKGNTPSTVPPKDKSKANGVVKGSGLTLRIKLNISSQEGSASAKKDHRPTTIKRDHEDGPLLSDSNSTGSDTDEMMAKASKQLEYLQRRINEKKLQRASSPNVGGSSGSPNLKASKPKTPIEVAVAVEIEVEIGIKFKGKAEVSQPLTLALFQIAVFWIRL
ncbi:Chromodomain-helicase-DNA-binding protein 9 [Mortierella alpina]|uniref:Chromodomain-helicase-DNA-binding protein 9 n=1 Tax=Mortierella alpina TaxID=64518 RepID=A0A9P6IY08_MORAP|nr:Chromodomain-helicase-DNA-binding protein 9 [Mortierella alpina]